MKKVIVNRRSSVSGRFVKKSVVASKPKNTVTERNRVGAKGGGVVVNPRGSITGKFVSSGQIRRNKSIATTEK